jgi:flavin reductase (DIM6/NTAB) family NADH-FMN oxidoreductase RutF
MVDAGNKHLSSPSSQVLKEINRQGGGGAMNKKVIDKGMPPLVLPICLLGSVHEGRANFCTVAWFTMIDDEPPTIGLVLGKKRFTKDGIVANKTFSVNIPTVEQAQVTDYCGIRSGYKVDKSSLFTIHYGKIEHAPLIEECPISIGCSLSQVLEFPGVDMIIGRVEEVLVDEDCLVNGEANQRKVRPLLYAMPGGPYVGMGDEVAKAFSIGKTLKKRK